MTISSSYFFDYTEYEHRQIFQGDPEPWRILDELNKYLLKQSLGLHHGVISPSAYLIHPELILIGEGSVVEAGAYIQGPCVIGKNCVVRHGAYIRGNVLTGNHCVIGHSSEVKQAIFLDKAHAAHFAYVGDSILGNEVNLGAGTKCANLRFDQKEIQLNLNGKRVSSQMRKFGAIIGDKTQIGCNAVTNPGTLIGKEVMCFPSIAVEGFIPSRSIIKSSFKPVIEAY